MEEFAPPSALVHIWHLLSILRGYLIPTLFACAIVFLLTTWNLSFRIAHSPTMSSDTVSSLFPDRPIRPLPKRRLREKLSPEAADAIKYPPSAVEAVPLFFYPPISSKKDTGGSNTPSSSTQGSSDSDGLKTFHGEMVAGSPAAGNAVDDAISRSTPVIRSFPEILSRGHGDRATQSGHSLQPEPKLPSATSSVDGYESFENTSNKKKRKIPTAADSVLNSVHSLHNEINSLAISSPRSPVSDIHERPIPNNYGGSSYLGSGQGISGPGRGRLARPGTGRSPLRAIPDGGNSWSARSGIHPG